MTDLSPILPLGEAKPRANQIGAIRIAENGDSLLASASLARGATPPRPFGMELPGPGAWASGAGISAFWTGPGQWLVEIEGRGNEDLLPPLKDAFSDCALTEQADGWVCLEVTSDSVPRLGQWFERLCNIDRERFPVYACTRTGLHHMSVFVIHRQAGHIAILGLRSAAESLWHAVEAAAVRVEGLPA